MISTGDTAISITNQWNKLHGQTFSLTPQLLQATFYSWPEDKRGVFSNDLGTVLYKIDDNVLRIHCAFSTSPAFAKTALTVLAAKARQLEKHRVVFGGGVNHLFPGIPILKGFEGWLASMVPMTPIQYDFAGDLEPLVAKAIPVKGVLRIPHSAIEQKDLAEFVHKEFPGRWSDEIDRDLKSGFGEHYFGFYGDTGLMGYVRLYGWNPNYIAPGVYWKTESRGKQGGLGPIGVARRLRGKGFGQQLLAASWRELANKGLKSVYVDWTMEAEFYKKAGLVAVHHYQPAKVDVL